MPGTSFMSKMILLLFHLALTSETVDYITAWGTDDIQMEGYLCNDKAEKNILPDFSHEICDHEEEFETKEEIDRIEVVVQRRMIPIKGKRCDLNAELAFHYCGSTWGAWTGRRFFFDVPLSKQDCESLVENDTMVHHQTWLDGGSDVDLFFGRSGRTLQINYRGATITGLEGGSFSVDGTCYEYNEEVNLTLHGETTTQRNQIVFITYTANYERVDLKFYTASENLEWRRGQILRKGEGGFDITKQGIFTFDPSHFNCSSRFGKKVYENVTIVEKSDGGRILVDKLEKMMALEDEGAKQTCLGELNATQAPNVFTCLGCTLEIDVLTPTEENLFTESGIKSHSGRVVLARVYDANFVIVQDRLCYLNTFLAHKHPDFYLGQFVNFRRDIKFTEKHGVIFFQDCEKKSVMVAQGLSNCFTNLPVTLDRDLYFLKKGTQELLQSSTIVNCEGNKTRFRGRTPEEEPLDVCGGPRYFPCDLEHNFTLPKIKFKKGSKIELLELFSLAEIEKHRQTREGDYMEDPVEGDSSGNIYREPERGGPHGYFERIAWSYVMKAWDTLCDLPLAGNIISFFLEHDQHSKALWSIIGVSIYEFLHDLFLKKEFKLVHIGYCILGVYSPVLFLIVKVYEGKMRDQTGLIEAATDGVREKLRDYNLNK